MSAVYETAHSPLKERLGQGDDNDDYERKELKEKVLWFECTKREHKARNCVRVSVCEFVCVCAI